MKPTSNNKTVSEFKTSKLKGVNRKKKNKQFYPGKNKKDGDTTCSTIANNDNTTNRKNLVNKLSATAKCGSTSITTAPAHQRNIYLPHGKQDYSANWKELSSSLSKTSLDKNSPKSLTSENNEPSTKKVTNNKRSKIWFDDVDKTLIEMKSDNVKSCAATSKNSENKSMPCTINFIPNLRPLFSKKEYVAIDCEMVGTGPDGKDNMLARVSLVDRNGVCVYDKFVLPRESITDYRTAVSGITPENLKNGTEFKIVQKEVSNLINDKILVGHAVSNDLKVLYLEHPRKKLRDTSRYKPFRKLFEGKTPSLKNLTKKFLGIEIQHGQHNSVIDALATMKIFKLHMQEWESNYGKSPNKSRKK